MNRGYEVVMICQAPSYGKEQNIYCGWFDTDLCKTGQELSKHAAKLLKESCRDIFDKAYTSVLKRAYLTLNIILDELALPDVPVMKTWRLNERHYGGLTGLDKSETIARYGELQVQIWLRSYDVSLPEMSPEHLYYDTIVHDSRYALDQTVEEMSCLPRSESYKDSFQRALSFWLDEIVPQIKDRKRVIIVGHLDSLRGILKHVCNLSEYEAINLLLPSAIPLVIHLNENMKSVKMQFLGDEETLEHALSAARENVPIFAI